MKKTIDRRKNVERGMLNVGCNPIESRDSQSEGSRLDNRQFTTHHSPGFALKLCSGRQLTTFKIGKSKGLVLKIAKNDLLLPGGELHIQPGVKPREYVRHDIIC